MSGVPSALNRWTPLPDLISSYAFRIAFGTGLGLDKTGHGPSSLWTSTAVLPASALSAGGVAACSGDYIEVVVVVAGDGEVPHPPVVDGRDRASDHDRGLAIWRAGVSARLEVTGG